MNQAVLITREPVIDRQRQIAANRFTVHAPNMQGAVFALNRLADAWPATHPALVNFGQLALTPELLAWTPPPNAMIEIDAAALADAHTPALIVELAAAGFNLCVSRYRPEVALPEGVKFHFVFVDSNEMPPPAELPASAIVTSLADLAAFEQAVKMGYAGASGWFFMHGLPPASELSPSHAQIVRLLNLVRNDAETREIEAALKLDVALSYKLLSYINSPAFSLVTKVQSFRHAVTILGLQKLNKWLSLLLVSASRDPSAPALMQAALARGRFMELVGAPFIDKREVDNLFITGAFSLIHILLGTTMEEVLGQMTLPEPIVAALLRAEGIYRPYLDLALACEQPDPAPLAECIARLRLRADVVDRAQLAAVAFSDTLQFN